MLVADLASFCVSAGYSKLAEDTVSLLFHRSTPNSVAIGNGMSIISSYYEKGSNSVDHQVSANRLVVKDPGADCYVHMIFYTSGDLLSYEGANSVRHHVDFYLSTGWDPGAAFDNHPGLVKATTLISLSPAPISLEMFSCVTSEGKLCVHAAVEDRPMAYAHFGFGCLEKLLDFTGGDYVTADCSLYSLYNYFGWCSAYSSWGWVQNESQSSMLQSAFYCPDLDGPNKYDAANLYRYFSSYSGNALARYDMEAGSSSSRITYDNYAMVNNVYMGGDLSIANLPLPNPWSGGTPLIPIIIFARDGADRAYSGPAGYFGGVRAINVKNLNPRDEIVLGADVWKAYPCKYKDGVLGATWCTNNQGFAIKRVD